VAEHGLDLALRLDSNPHPSRNVLFVALTQNSAAISTENSCPKLFGARTKNKKLPIIGLSSAHLAFIIAN
jgi:hypothetical protein